MTAAYEAQRERASLNHPLTVAALDRVRRITKATAHIAGCPTMRIEAVPGHLQIPISVRDKDKRGWCTAFAWWRTPKGCTSHMPDVPPSGLAAEVDAFEARVREYLRDEADSLLARLALVERATAAMGGAA